MTRLTIFVSAPFSLGSYVHAEVHELLRESGMSWNSVWAMQASGLTNDNFHTLDREAQLRILDENDSCVQLCDALVILVEPGKGRSSFGEARFAAALGKPVVWVGPDPTLPSDAWRRDAIRVRTVNEAIVELRRMAVAREGKAA